MIRVYHNPRANFFVSKIEDVALMTNADLVAEVDGESFDLAFEATNHINCPWWENAPVKCIKKSRSTSIGDVMINNKNEWVQVAMIGFIPIKPIGAITAETRETKCMTCGKKITITARLDQLESLMPTAKCNDCLIAQMYLEDQESEKRMEAQDMWKEINGEEEEQ